MGGEHGKAVESDGASNPSFPQEQRLFRIVDAVEKNMARGDAVVGDIRFRVGVREHPERRALNDKQVLGYRFFRKGGVGDSFLRVAADHGDGNAEVLKGVYDGFGGSAGAEHQRPHVLVQGGQ